MIDKSSKQLLIINNQSSVINFRVLAAKKLKKGTA